MRFRNRLVLFVVAVVAATVVVIVASSQFITDWMWFSQLGLGRVFTTRIVWPWGLGLVAGIIVAVFLFLNLRLTRPVIFRLIGRYQDRLPQGVSWRWIQRLFLAVAVAFGFMYGAEAAMNWETVAAALHALPYGLSDPIFNKDIGFYLFQFPLYEWLYTIAVSLLTLTVLGVGTVYVASGSLYFAEGRPVVAPRAKTHITLLLTGLVLLKAGDYILGLYRLLYSPTGVVFGAGYADLFGKAVALRILIIVALFTVLALVFNLFRPGTKYIIGGLGLLLVSSVVLGGIYPSLLQRFVVGPDELNKETPFIRHNVDLTREAFDLANINADNFAVSGRLTPELLDANSETVDNIRLWDTRPLLRTLSQLQEFRLYYTFASVDVDRYEIDGRLRQVMLGARELDVNSLQNPTWINQHLQYTHGYGLVMSPVNRVTAEGLPEFFLADIPPRTNVDLEVNRPEIYYGERTPQYVIVNTATEEFDYPKGDHNAFTNYKGTGGIPLTGFLQRALFSLRTGTIKILLAGTIKPESRIMFYRDISDRVRRIAPFLKYDRDPYLVLSDDGRLYWIIDAYTINDRFPYSQPVRGWGNYARNSVKVLVDAYNGTVRFFISDPKDPVVKVWSQIYPDLFEPLANMPDGLRSHIRYPEDFFRTQALVYSVYHMDDPSVFYNQEDVWSLPTEIYETREQAMDPYYVVMRLPGSPDPEMVLLLPFTPREKNNMIAWMAARNDAANYGKLLLYKFPKQELTFGPMQIESRIDQDADISQLLTLWSQKGSRVIRGNLLTIPIGDTLLYVEPLYLQSEQSDLPELKRVIVAQGSKVVMGLNLADALQRLVGGRVSQPSQKTPQSPAEGPGTQVGNTVAQLIQKAQTAYTKAIERQKAGDWAGYGTAIQELEAILKQLRDAAVSGGSMGAENL